VERQDTGKDWTIQYDYLPDGIYYFHVKAKDVAGNWGDTSHYKFRVAAGGIPSLIYSPVDGEIAYSNGTDVNITVKVSVADNASVQVITLHEDGSNFTSAPVIFNTTYEFQNITLEFGLNELYALTNSTAGAFAHSPHIFVRAVSGPEPMTNKTLRVVFGGGGNIQTYHTYQTVGGMYVGFASEYPGVSVGGGTLTADTEDQSIKIFMTRPFDTSQIDQELGDDEFLDRINPAFGYRYGSDSYVVRNELRYRDLKLGGNFFLPPGIYDLHIRKSGVTPEGEANITLMIG